MVFKQAHLKHNYQSWNNSAGKWFTICIQRHNNISFKLNLDFFVYIWITAMDILQSQLVIYLQCWNNLLFFKRVLSSRNVLFAYHFYIPTVILLQAKESLQVNYLIRSRKKNLLFKNYKKKNLLYFDASISEKTISPHLLQKGEHFNIYFFYQILAFQNFVHVIRQ